MPVSFGNCGEPLVTGDAVWITGCSASQDIVRIDPATNTVVAQVPLGGKAVQPVMVDGAIWVPVISPGVPGALVRIDPTTNTVTRRVHVEGLADLGGAVVVADTLWVANGVDRVVGIPLSELTAS